MTLTPHSTQSHQLPLARMVISTAGDHFANYSKWPSIIKVSPGWWMEFTGEPPSKTKALLIGGIPVVPAGESLEVLAWTVEE